MAARYSSEPRKDTTRVNERIRSREIRLVGVEGDQLGVMAPEDAMALADEQGLDLVEVAPNAAPPVCRIMDYGKYKYEEKKKRAASKTRGSASLKEVKLRPGTDDHDMGFKLKNARRFLMDGDKVKVTVMFRGREMVHRQQGYKQLDKVRELLGELAAMENPPRMEGRFLSMILVGNREEVAKLKREEEQALALAGAVETEASAEASVVETETETETEASAEAGAGGSDAEDEVAPGRS